jgi:hypothetical protein
MCAALNKTTIPGPERSADATQPVASGLVAAWTRGRKQITPWAYPYLRALGPLRLTVGLFVTVVGALLISHGHDGLAVVPLAGAALLFAIGSLDTAAARYAHRHE